MFLAASQAIFLAGNQAKFLAGGQAMLDHGNQARFLAGNLAMFLAGIHGVFLAGSRAGGRVASPPGPARPFILGWWGGGGVGGMHWSANPPLLPLGRVQGVRDLNQDPCQSLPRCKTGPAPCRRPPLFTIFVASLGFKIAPRAPKIGPRADQDRPRALQEGPREPNIAPDIDFSSSLWLPTPLGVNMGPLGDLHVRKTNKNITK